jgi:hypothetical protein
LPKGASAGYLDSFDLEGYRDRIWDLEKENGYESLSIPQRYYSAVFMCDAEVCNGGFAQYFVNSSGDRWRDAVAGFEAMGSTERLRLVRSAISQFGPDGPSTDREIRQEQLSKLYRRNDTCFEDLERQYFASNEVIDVIATRYVIAHPDDFR